MDDEPPQNPLEWRPANGDQAREARALALAVLAGAGVPGDDGEAERLPDALRKTGGEFWTLLVKEVCVGTLGLRHDGGGVYLLRWWAVAEGHRGIGLGTFMLGRAVSWARDGGAREIRAAVPPDREAAVTALTANGFRRVPEPVPGPDGALFVKQLAGPSADG